jgi:outer membrane scaffolding protein for murein synthesis (MipA/OmpV family)
MAEELPLWELGLGVGGLYQPYYPGSDQTRAYAFPVPLPIYRGSVFKSDDEGMRAELIKDGPYKLDMSLDFNLAIDSDDVDLRAGMPDIDSMLQIGPSLEVTLAKGEHSEWLLNFPVRANFGIGSNGLEESGYTFSPNITYFRDMDWSGTPWRAGIALGMQAGSRDYQNVYYGVDQQFSTANRPSYEAESGFSGSRALLTLKSNNKKRLWVWFLRYDNISGASFEDSPLVDTSGGLSAGFVYSRYLFKSKRLISRQ